MFQYVKCSICLYIIFFLPIFPGRCPKITQLNDICSLDRARCRYDNECPGEDEKCCLNPGCGYKECLSIRQVNN